MLTRQKHYKWLINKQLVDMIKIKNNLYQLEKENNKSKSKSMDKYVLKTQKLEKGRNVLKMCKMTKNVITTIVRVINKIYQVP